MDVFVGEIIMFAFNFNPRGFLMCNGQIMAINTNQALFSLLGVVYGGNGTTTFALPNLQGRAPMHAGNLFSSNFPLGNLGGQESITLTVNNLPMHSHQPTTQQAIDVNVEVGGINNMASPDGSFLAEDAGVARRFAATYDEEFQKIRSINTTQSGNNMPHNNMMPYLVINFCIALQGVYPSRN